MNARPWRIWIDTGGTFTDCIAHNPSDQLSRLKVLSSGVMRVPVLAMHGTSIHVRLPLTLERNFLQGFTARIGGEVRKIIGNEPGTSILFIDRALSRGNSATMLDIYSGEEVPVFATRLLTQTSLSNTFPLVEMKLGSTRGTNALLERKGARTALLITKGFKDLLEIGNQQRADLFSLMVKKPDLLYHDVIEIDERILANGDILKPLSPNGVAFIIRRLRRRKIDSVAIALLNSYSNSVHEDTLGRSLNDAGFSYVSLSHSLSRQVKILPRAQTTLVNAYLDPVIRQYLSQIGNGLGSASIKIMSSAGGLLNLETFQPKDSLLSGPAGGVVGALEKARLTRTTNIITFDMGGTSTDVSRCAGQLEYQFECVVGGQRILSPSLAIETIAAGGGSVCYFDGYKLCVGPQSAGAQPGPACYGMGGPLTITDVNLLLGRISAAHFTIPLHSSASELALQALKASINAQGTHISRNELLLSCIDIANERMAEAIRKISVQKGHDPQDYSLLCFGGAGGQHACSLAALLRIKKIILPYDAGLLSAFGIGTAKEEQVREKLILAKLDEVLPNLEAEFNLLASDAAAGFAKHRSHDLESDRRIFLRLNGQETTLEVLVSDVQLIEKQFQKQYRLLYGHYLSHRTIEVESIRVITRESRKIVSVATIPRRRYTPDGSLNIAAHSHRSDKHNPVFEWESLRPGALIEGPAIVVSQNSTAFVAKGWTFELDQHNNAIVTRSATLQDTSRASAAANLTLFTNRFTSVVEDMGSLLQRSSFSVNVKERLDFSCALLDAKGTLVVNAPHIPVHLGSLGVCVREVARVIPFEPGDVVITNHPAFGGSHLPDITLIKPVYFENTHIGYVVNRAHHAEIGGKKPGSMPADAHTLEEEGVIIAPTYLVRKGVPQWQTVHSLLKTAQYPSRSPDENIADLNGALASLMLGASALELLCRAYGDRQVMRYMREIRSHAATLMRKKILRLKSRYQAIEYLDDGTRLKASITRHRGLLYIDFTGTSEMHAGNLNATVAIVNSVVLYVLRLLVGETMPLNEGLFEHVKLVIPAGILRPIFARMADSVMPANKTRAALNGKRVGNPAVVGGNTEVSQRLTDTLLKAFGLAACSQGTMNNVLFGNERFGYYETICGGAGATKGSHGADAVHTHMTNTRITDPEILELKYPVRLEKFSVRKNSGGKGRWNGGNGVTRVFVFNDTLEVNILSQHRIEKPYGIYGGLPGKTGRQSLISDGKTTNLKGIAGFTVKRGDWLIIDTPGGGGWGKP